MADKAGTPDFRIGAVHSLVGYPTIVMGHGGRVPGNELVELFLPAFRNPALENLGDAAVLISAQAE
jgi:hypothetical protein